MKNHRIIPEEAEEEGGINQYSLLRNDGLNSVDLFGLRPLTEQEQTIIRQLIKLSENAGNKDPEFAKALAAIIADIQAFVGSVKGHEDPASLRIGLGALRVWIDPKQSALYGNKVSGSSCNKYVARVVNDAGFELHVPTTYGGWLPDWRTVPSAAQWADTMLLGQFKIVWMVKPIPGRGGSSVGVFIEQGVGARRPKFGDVIVFPYVRNFQKLWTAGVEKEGILRERKETCCHHKMAAQPSGYLWNRRM